MGVLEFQSWCQDKRWIRILDRWFQIASTHRDRLDEFCRQYPVATDVAQSTDSSLCIWDIAGGSGGRLARDGQHFFRGNDGAVYCMTADTSDLTDLEIAFRWVLRRNAPDWGYHIYHTSAVEKDGRAAVFPAQGGAGKSTLALGLVMMKGYRLIGDDLICITRSNGNRHMVIEGITLSFKIRADILSTLDEVSSSYPITQSVGARRRDKQIYLLKPEYYASSARLCAAVTICCHRLCTEPRLTTEVGADADRWKWLYHWCEPDHPECSEQALKQFWAGVELGTVGDSLLSYDLKASVNAVDSFLHQDWRE